MTKHTIFKIFCASLLIASVISDNATAQGTIYTVAGDSYRIPGDNRTVSANVTTGTVTNAGQVANAVFSSPNGVATDAAGNIYMADYSGHSIRMISPGGTITTIANTSVHEYATAGGVTMTAGSVAVSESTVASRTSANAGNTLPDGGWKDQAGNTYVADHSGNKLTKTDAGTNAVQTITGGNGRGFSPDGTLAVNCKWGLIGGVCTDAAGNIYVSDKVNHVVRMINKDGVVNTIAGTGVSGYSGDGGNALGATLRTPANLFMNNAGNLFICDPMSNVVRVMNPNAENATIETLAGNGTMGFSGDGGNAKDAALNNPTNVWQDAAGVIYIADMGNMRIRSVTGSKYVKEASTNFSIFPNPSIGSFNVSVKTPTGVLDVYNIMGVKVYSTTISKQQTTVTLNEPAGIYDVVVKSEGISTNQKIVIEK